METSRPGIAAARAGHRPEVALEPNPAGIAPAAPETVHDL